MGFFSRKKQEQKRASLLAVPLSEALAREVRANDIENCPAKVSAESLTFESILSRSFSYRSLSAVYSCIEIISNALSSMPLRVMRQDEHGHKEFVRHHPLQRIFNNKNIQMMSI